MIDRAATAWGDGRHDESRRTLDDFKNWVTEHLEELGDVGGELNDQLDRTISMVTP